MIVIQVALPIPIANNFDYLLPNNLSQVAIGGRVTVPFNNRKIIGIVVKIVKRSNFSIQKLQNIINVLDINSLYSPPLWHILNWSADYYHYPLGKVLFHAIPVLLRKGKVIETTTLKKWIISNKGKNSLPEKFVHAPKQQQALAVLRTQAIYQNEIRQYNINETELKNLNNKGLCEIQFQKYMRKDWRDSYSVNKKEISLNHEQNIAVKSIYNAGNQFSAWLLAGITGSGKTEVYLSVLEKILENGRQALVMVPEISLTHQILARFRKRFNVPIDVLHSGINKNERLAVWSRARCGETAIVIGTRSALFTPFCNLGIIIVDEEHDISYKQQQGWRYQARDLAVFRANKENIPVIMGSATPALETLHNVQLGKYYKLNLSKRAGNANKSIQILVDVKGIKLQGGLSPILIKKISQHIKDDNQVLLFLNRRGFAPILLCHECGWIAKCQSCNRYYTLHLHIHQQLYCHDCGRKNKITHQCAQCGSTHLLPIGLGTEQLEHNLKLIFPQIPVTRIDLDTTKRKGALEKHLIEIHKGGARILVGTQMLSKGHHFPDVTLVILLNVDSALFSVNFRSAERFAQLYIQVAGRAGRSKKQGEVLLQTHYPNHPLLNTLLNKGYEEFALQELNERSSVLLPPFTHHALFFAEAYDNKQVYIFLQKLYNGIKSIPLNNEHFWITEPRPSFQPKRCGRYRWQLLIQHTSRVMLKEIIKSTLTLISYLPQSRKVNWSLDIDPNEH